MIVATGLVMLTLATAEPQRLTPDDAVRAALEHNNGLRAAELRVDEERPEARLLPTVKNPSLRVGHNAAEGVLFGARTKGGIAYGPLDDGYIALQVKLPAPSELGPRQLIGSALVAEQEGEREAVKRELTAEVRLLHAKLIVLAAERELDGEAIELTKRLHAVTTSRMNEGAATLLDESLSALDELDAVADRAEIDSEERTSRHRFAALTGLGDVRFELVPPAQPLCAVQQTRIDQLVPRAVERSPKMQILAAQESAAAHETTRTAISLVPWVTDVQVAFINEPLDARDSMRIRADIELPLFDFHLHDFDKLAARRARLQAERRSEEDQIAAAVRRAVEELEGQRAVIDLYAKATDGIIDHSLDVIARALDAGQVDVRAVAALQARSLKAKRKQLRARLSCEEAAVEIMRLTGIDS